MPAARNDTLIKTLGTSFVRSNNAAHAWNNVVGNHLLLSQLRAFWPFSSVNESGAVFDLSGQGRTLTNNGSTPFDRYGLAPYADFTAASSQYFSRADEAGLDVTGELTFGGWFWFNILGVTEGLISKHTTAGNQRAYILDKLTTNAIRLRVHLDGGSVNYNQVTSAAVTIGQWYHIVGRFTPSTELALFVNGLKTVNTTTIVASIFNSTAILAVGRYSEAVNYMDGRVSLGFLCATNLPDSVIQALYQYSRALFGR